LTAYAIFEFEDTEKLPLFDRSLISKAFRYIINNHTVAEAGRKLKNKQRQLKEDTLSLFEKFNLVWDLIKPHFGADFNLPYIDSRIFSNTIEYLSTSLETNISLHFTVYIYFLLYSIINNLKRSTSSRGLAKSWQLICECSANDMAFP
jgi:hypothetical protein